MNSLLDTSNKSSSKAASLDELSSVGKGEYVSLIQRDFSPHESIANRAYTSSLDSDRIDITDARLAPGCMHPLLNTELPGFRSRAWMTAGWRRGRSLHNQGTIRLLCEQIKHVDRPRNTYITVCKGVSDIHVHTSSKIVSYLTCSTFTVVSSASSETSRARKPHLSVHHYLPYDLH